MEYTQQITLDLNTNTAYTTIGAKQGDNGSRTIEVYITQNGQDYNLITNNVTSAYYRLHKPDGKAVINSATIDKSGKFLTLLFTAQGLAVPGRAYCDIVLQNGSQILSTVSFILIIMAAPAVAEQGISGNEFGFLTAIVNDATIIVQDAQAWATGTRGDQDVYGEQSIIATEDSSVITSVSVTDTNSFFNRFDHISGAKRTFEFVYQESGNWRLTITTEQGTKVEVSGPEIITEDLSQDGITIVLLENIIDLEGNSISVVAPNNGDIITIIVEEPDPAYNNNAKYYSEIAAASAALLDNIPAVRYDKTQSLTSTQKATARNNIGAQPSGDYQPAGNYIVEPTLPSSTKFLRYNTAISAWDCATVTAETIHALPSILNSAYYGDTPPVNPVEGQLFFVRVQDN